MTYDELEERMISPDEKSENRITDPSNPESTSLETCASNQSHSIKWRRVDAPVKALTIHHQLKLTRSFRPIENISF